METRAALFAKGLAKGGLWKPCVAVGDQGQVRKDSRDGVDLVVYRPILKAIQDNVVPRFGKYRWRIVLHLDKRDLQFVWQFPAYLMFQLLPKCWFNRFWKRLAPDVVCCFGNNRTSAETIADCYRSGIKTVLCIASDEDLSSEYQPGSRQLNDYGTPHWMAWYAINTADSIMLQTERQRELLKTRFCRSGVVVRNPVVVEDGGRAGWIQRRDREFVLWVGRADTFGKRPLLALDLARACPDIKFLMIANRADPRVFEAIVRTCPANVSVVEHVPHHEIAQCFRRARVFLNTSVYEGFPNTFLQAAVYGAPVVSLSVDPENVLEGRQCGIWAGDDLGRLGEAVRALWTDEALADRYAATFYDYVRGNHELNQQVEGFQAFLESVAAAPPADPAPGCWRRPFKRFIPRARQRGR